MNYWLMKNEPEDYNIDDLARDKIEPWTLLETIKLDT